MQQIKRDFPPQWPLEQLPLPTCRQSLRTHHRGHLGRVTQFRDSGQRLVRVWVKDSADVPRLPLMLLDKDVFKKGHEANWAISTGTI